MPIRDVATHIPTCPWILDLDDLGSHVREIESREGTGPELLDRNDTHSLERRAIHGVSPDCRRGVREGELL